MIQALSYLSPVAGLPFGAAPSATASPPAGFRGQTLAVFLRDDQARCGDTVDFTRPESPSAGRRALQDVQGQKGLNVTPMPFFLSWFRLKAFMTDGICWQWKCTDFVENN